LLRIQSSEPLHAKMNPTSCLFGSRFACAQTGIYSAEPFSKNAGETSIVFGLQLVSKESNIPQSKPKKSSIIFSSNKVCQPIGRRIFCKT
jgi:hypothetical protein